MTSKQHARKRALPSLYYTWKLERPRKPALPSSYFWTWDHSCNWVLDDPGIQTGGCNNPYFKASETFVEDYRRLTDLAAWLGIKGIVIWGFLRDAHGGVEAAKKVAAYAASKGVAIMPGFGTTWYGGAYYEGEHPYSLTTFLKKYTEARMLGKDGRPMTINGEHGACLAHPAYREWLREAVAWLYREFEIGGLNLENGDFLTDAHPLVQAMRKEWPADDPEVFFHQGLSYRQALTAIGERLADTLGIYATYTGFQYTDTLAPNTGIGQRPPAMLKLLPEQSLCQWTLTGMLLAEPLPLTAYLDDGAPTAAFANPNWPADLKAPAPRNVGFIHQGSQWRSNRYQCIVSTIKEACLRSYRSGLEGVSIVGEVTARNIPNALNYLAFSHFTHWPEDNLRAFGRKTLGPVLGSEADGEAFAEVLAHWDAGTATDDHKKLAQPGAHGIRDIRDAGSSGLDVAEYQRFRFWEWLAWVVAQKLDRHHSICFGL
ncbi:MAG: hypothetical protein HYV36_01435 [Lentisphaerae bacterium]|nr:hypothetical protein [Lentisphaerota bacterium]